MTVFDKLRISYILSGFLFCCCCLLLAGSLKPVLLKRHSVSEEAALSPQLPVYVQGGENDQISKKDENCIFTMEECRDVLRTAGQGGMGEFSIKKVVRLCDDPGVYGACEDLQLFTGLSNEEFMSRMRRLGRFHFEGEHNFWNPSSRTELAWYYSSSVSYLFANTVHSAQVIEFDSLAWKEHEPVLDYSGGVGNNVIHLAKKGVRTHYFGIGVMEYRFAQYRIQKLGLEHMVTFKQSFCSDTEYKFDPITDPLPGDESLGAILAFDVLEHVPDYHVVVQAMVKSIKVGGVIIESSPFADKVSQDEEDTRVHLSNGGISMEEAMGQNMKQIRRSVWKKMPSL